MKNNRRQKDYIELFKKIVEELDKTQFTIKEIIQEFCSYSNIKILDPNIKPVNFTIKDLNKLKKLGLIIYNRKIKYYELTEEAIILYENMSNIYDKEDIISFQEFIFDNQSSQDS
jgi:hypothetical protein